METDGRLVRGETLREAIETVDRETDGAPEYFMINCAHPTHFDHALKAGEPEAAAALLTRPFAIAGAVQHGDKRGRKLGYPTANMTLGDYLRPRYGIYAVRGVLPGGIVVDGVANLGLRPQFEPVELLEPHFFDWSGDLYGAAIAVELVSFIRPEAKFDDLPSLIAQMDADSAIAKARLATSHRLSPSSR